ncbi:MAG: hypothetical protein AAB526_02075 [Patescibacteria group bacterium]
MIINKQNLMVEAGIKYQNKVAGLFKKYGLQYEALDKEKKDKMPDYYVYKNNKEQGFICEVKSIISGGSQENGKYLLSTRDPEFMEHIKLDLDNPKNEEIMKYNYGSKNLEKKLKEKLNEAVQQYKNLIRCKQEYKDYPFVIVICEDFYAEVLDSYNLKMIFDDLQEISAIIRLEKNYEKKQVHQEHLKKLNEYCKNRNKNSSVKELSKNWEKDCEGVPDTIRFRVWLNRKAKIKFKPENFFRNPIID